jgi:hypothetical protein
MDRGRKKEKRSKMAGKRFKTAQCILGRTYENFLINPRSNEIVAISDIRPLRDWIKNGLSVRRIGDIEVFFPFANFLLIYNSRVP